LKRSRIRERSWWNTKPKIAPVDGPASYRRGFRVPRPPPETVRKIEGRSPPQALPEPVDYQIFSQRDSQGFVVPPPPDHFEFVQTARALGTVSPTRESRRSTRKTLTTSKVVNKRMIADLALNLFPRNGPQQPNFRSTPKDYNEWALWNRYRGIEQLRERRGARLLTSDRALKTPDLVAH
jgi:hypothetical protein